MSEPTNGEVMRRLDEVSRQLVQLAQDMRTDRNAAADTYVRKDVFSPMHDSHKRRLDALELENTDREKAQDQFRRQIVVGLILLAIPALFSLVLALNNLTASGGATP